MKATLYLKNQKAPVAVLEDVKIVQMNDNHSKSPYRVAFSTPKLNAGRTMLELHRDEKLTMQLEDGRKTEVLLQHTSIDSKGNAVGVLRVLGSL
ncbi:MAG: hypothetical protein KF832_10715 [Caldilineaceae bacterium]|nr:hypothetical protein [Caldilineaceae bacterium]